jgi:hypothetical protein
MDFSNPGALVSSCLIGLIGMVLFMYGKKQEKMLPLLTGIALCIFPYFVASIAAMWAITGAALGGLWYASRNA